jgi:hypothetical protein
MGTEMIHTAKGGPPKVRQSLCQLVTFDSRKRDTIECLQMKGRTLSLVHPHTQVNIAKSPNCRPLGDMIVHIPTDR